MGASPMQLAAQRLFMMTKKRLAAANAWARRPCHAREAWRGLLDYNPRTHGHRTRSTRAGDEINQLARDPPRHLRPPPHRPQRRRGRRHAARAGTVLA